MVVHAFNPTLRWQKQADLSGFKATLVYKSSSRTARATQRNPVLKNKHKVFRANIEYDVPSSAEPARHSAQDL